MEKRKNGIWYILIIDASGNRIQRAESTGLPERGNKKKAKELLDRRLEELSHLSPETIQKVDILFLDFMQDWLDNVVSLEFARRP